MKTKTNEFIKKAIENGYDDNRTYGWDWIRNNLQELDSIFQTGEYKKQGGMKSKCMPFLIQDNELSVLEMGILETAWYLNNERVHKKEKKERIKKLNKEGFFNIADDEKLDKKKIEWIQDTSCDYFGGLNKYTGKLSWSKVDKRLMCLQGKHRRRGHWNSENIYIKFI